MTATANKINAYTCSQGHTTITIDRESGVTPIFIRCKPSCSHMARSNFYQVDQSLAPTHEWYKPADIKKLKLIEREHVLKGGLLLREIKKAQ